MVDVRRQFRPVSESSFRLKGDSPTLTVDAVETFGKNDVSDGQVPATTSRVGQSALPAKLSPRSSWSFQPLPYREVRRRLWHMTPGLLPLILQLVSHADPISPTMYVIAVGCCVAIGLRILTNFRQIQRVGEGTGASAVAGYALSVLLTIVMFPAHMEIGVGVLAILAFGDGSATLFGLMLRGPRLPWNSAKSWSGLIAFCLVGSLMSAWTYAGETWNPEALEQPVKFTDALLIVLPAVIASGLAESVRTRINDNIRVGVVAACMLTAMHFLSRSL